MDFHPRKMHVYTKSANLRTQSDQHVARVMRNIISHSETGAEVSGSGLGAVHLSVTRLSQQISRGTDAHL